MDAVVRSNNNPVNDMTVLMSGLINDLDKVIKTKIVKVDIHVTNKTNMSWEVVYVVKKVRQLFSKHSQ